MEWVKPIIKKEKVKAFNSPIDALICAEGAAGDLLVGSGELAKEAMKILLSAIVFSWRFRQK